jgi:tetratricopeptide (TPR) repeat protein
LLESTDTIQDTQRKTAIINQSIYYLKRAVTIHPVYSDALLLLGNAYFKKENATDSAVWCYASILTYNHGYDMAFSNMQALVNREKDTDVKIKLLGKMLQYRPNDYHVNYQLGKIYGKEKNDLEKAISYLTKASQANPREKDAYLDLGVAYGLKRDYAKSAAMLQKALEIDPNDVDIYINLGVTWQNLGQTAKAAECFKKAEAMKK